ncbi:MAG: hypothetical protein EOO43_11365 [Flavobacterium sp.]|nr:MAG: hypothetical protein EOO43_11365 [Flavobacterium sp.]
MKYTDSGFAQIPTYNKFGFVELKNTFMVISQENGEDTPIPFQKIIKSIEAYQGDINLYNEGPSSLRN